MQGVNDRNILYEGTTGEGRPIEGVDVNEVKLGAPLSQFEKEFEKEVGLSKESGIGVTLLQGPGEVGRKDFVRHVHRFNSDAGNERIVPGEKCQSMAALYQPLGKVSEESLRATWQRLGHGL